MTAVAQRGCGPPLSGCDQGQVGWGSEKSDLIEGDTAHSRGFGAR